jgi:ABC-type phosphate transport system substrate-binding protein
MAQLKVMHPLSFFLIVALSISVVRAEVRVVGSDLLGSDFVPAVSAYSQRQNLGLTLKLEGSRAGLEKLEGGQADLAVVHFSPNEKLPGDPFVVWPVAYQTAVVVVPAALPLTQITFEQLNMIYGDSAQAGLKRWQDLGVKGDWALRNILPNLLGSSGGLTYDLFRYTVLSGPTLRPTVEVQVNMGDSVTRILGAEGGVAVLPVLPDNQPQLKALLVARGGAEVAFGPSADNLHTGDYPIRLPLYLVFRKDAAKRLQAGLNYLLSEEAVSLWERAQLVPLPLRIRNQLILDLSVL